MLKTIERPTIIQLKAKITKLEQNQEVLRLLLHELIDDFYKAINQTPQKSKILCLECLKKCIDKEKTNE